MAFIVRCRYCKTSTNAVLMVEGLIEQPYDDALRAHLREAHPDVPVTAALGDLLRHFNVEPKVT